MKKRAILLFACLAVLWYCGAGWADNGISGVISNLLVPIKGAVSLVQFMVGIAGSGLTIYSLVKLKEYWQQTTDTGLATILMLLAVGLALVSLIFLPVFQ